jgi:hypothetical protein
MFLVLAFAFWMVTAWRILHAARATQGQGEPSIDMLSLAASSFRDPMFWVAFVVMLTVGTIIVNLRKL